jgi:hypothetical protein
MSDICSTVPQWRTSAENRAIELWTSRHTSRDVSRDTSHPAPLLLIGGVHGDEPEGIHLATDTLTWLKTRPLATVVPWIVVPCLNVDGAARDSRVNANGVDLNRNYPSANWSPEFKTERYFPGPRPGSEIEVQGIVELIQTFRPQTIIHCHSYHPCIVMTGEPGRIFAEPLARASGYEITHSIGYETPGSLSSYGWHDLGIPVICIEEREGASRAETWRRFAPAMAEIFGTRE